MARQPFGVKKLKADYPDYGNIFQTVDRLKEIANQLRTVDIIDPDMRTMNLISEMVARIKHLQIEPVDFASQGIMRSFN